jgi:hypothetical protein
MIEISVICRNGNLQEFGDCFIFAGGVIKNRDFLDQVCAESKKQNDGFLNFMSFFSL